MREKEVIARGAVRVFDTACEKLRIIKTYNDGGCYLSYGNRLNPLTYIMCLYGVLICPFYAMFTDCTVQDCLGVVFSVAFLDKEII